jgi:hypothetical protein
MLELGLDECFFLIFLCFNFFPQWSRAKLVSRLLRRHPTLSGLQQEHWTTKEILLYARKYAFTPTIAMSSVDETQPALDADNKNYLKEMIKKEIKREKLKYCSLSLNHAVHDWLSQMYSKCKVQESLSCQDEVINIMDDSDDVGAFKHKNNYNSASIDCKYIHGHFIEKFKCIFVVFRLRIKQKIAYAYSFAG